MNSLILELFSNEFHTYWSYSIGLFSMITRKDVEGSGIAYFKEKNEYSVGRTEDRPIEIQNEFRKPVLPK
jgi:hypothetical protein